MQIENEGYAKGTSKMRLRKKYVLMTYQFTLPGSSYQDGPSGSSSSSTQGYGVYNSDQLKASRESFFEKQQEKNASRPDHIPPSQGGKYAGFGNQAYTPAKKQQQEMMDNTWASGKNALL